MFFCRDITTGSSDSYYAKVFFRCSSFPFPVIASPPPEFAYPSMGTFLIPAIMLDCRSGGVMKKYLPTVFVAVLSVTCLPSYSFGIDEVKKLLGHSLCLFCDLSGANLEGADLSGALLFRADLSNVNLYGANLMEAHLRGADLTGTNLSDALLFRADLSYANLQGVNLTGTNLSRAGLTGTNLSDALLFRADLSYANLQGADLSRADLTGADLTGADLTGTMLRRADLGGAILCQTKTPWGEDNSDCK